ncbi:MAG: GNAT family N-acetyltransferase [Stackebrandtia sp.]
MNTKVPHHTLVASATRRYTAKISRHPDDILAAQRLRYDVFVRECGAFLHGSYDERDVDDFDALGDHAIVVEEATGRVVGACRLLPPGRSRLLHSSAEFDVSALELLRDQLVEAVKACVHADHRDGPAAAALWSAVVDYVRDSGCRYLVGCAPLRLDDTGRAAATMWDRVRDGHMSPPELRVSPYLPWNPDAATRGSDVKVPTLLRGCLRRGAVACGPPAYDPDAGAADLLMLLDLKR